jgi:hypothetical protein
MQMVEVHDMTQEDKSARSPRLEDEDEENIREAYLLMDAIARQEGWDDPEMDSYNVHARKP